MKIAENTVVSIDYTLTDEEGNMLEKSDQEEAFAYLHGHGQLPNKLEEALSGKGVGENVSINIIPEEGFGERDEAQVITVPRDRFPEGEDLVDGLQVEAETEHGHHVFTIINVEDETVTLDGNHPYAGYTLSFDVTVTDVREAAPEELEHGHAHNGEHHH